ncbi:MAG: SRPBCC domain-containing protein [Propionibacteriaceae bacterium]|jgi:hypothetical protein|nr:SRPBCC domain-containing protein [Propionibacteriaceae bacterium]
MTDLNGSGPLPNVTDTTVSVSRVVSTSLKETWKLLNTQAGNEALLGKGGVVGDKGDSWRSEEGTFGVIRSYHPLEQIRFYWYAAEGAPKTVVDVLIAPEGEGTRITINHERVPAYFDTAKIASRWENAIDTIIAQ